MPVAVARIILTLLPKDKLLTWGALILLLPMAGLLFVTSSITAVVKTVPLISPEDYVLYQNAVKQIGKETKIMINIRELIAIDAVLLKQDFSRATRSSVLDLADRFIWIEEHIKEDGTVIIIYHLRSLEEVLQELIEEGKLEEAEKEDVYRYLQTDWSDPSQPDSTLPGDPSSAGFVFPVSGGYTITGRFLERINPVTGKWEFHKGIDFAAPKNTPIVAAKKGKVIFVQPNGTAGNEIKIDHGEGIVTRYLHLATFNVQEGESVEAGQQIGGMGTTGQSTGSHLHFEIHLNGEAVDPMPYLK